jgi:dienelactone hydrolase
MSVNELEVLREELCSFLNYEVHEAPAQVVVHEEVREDGYMRRLVSYVAADGDEIGAYLLLPDSPGSHPGMVVHHQHNSEWSLGKSEVAGLAGDPLQAFGPALAKRGICVLAPDSICFEDRRRDPNADDYESGRRQHYLEMVYRLARGDTLMRKVLSDGSAALSVLSTTKSIDRERIGALGHSYGGNTVLFHTAVDDRICFACASGAACRYRYKMAHEIGIEMAEVIPGFTARFDIDDLVKCAAPRPMLIVSADGDEYSQDADEVAQSARQAYAAIGTDGALEHARYAGGHELTAERFARIVEWCVGAARV